MKYAFIMNSKSLTPENYSSSYENEGNTYYFTAVHGMKMTREVAKRLADEGYEMIDLCGDYNEEKTEDIRKTTEGKIKVNFAKYSDVDTKKFDALESTSKFGIIVQNFTQSEGLFRLELESEEFNTYIAIAGSEQIAAKAAIVMVEEGINFIELCGYFDAAKAAAIAKAINHEVPIGYCGN